MHLNTDLKAAGARHQRCLLRSDRLSSDCLLVNLYLTKSPRRISCWQMASATIPRTVDDAVETRRRSLMAESDDLLDDVERLRLDDHSEVPQPLREAIRALQVRLGRTDSPVAPATLHAAHDLVFAVQQRLMAANPKHPRPNRHAGRPGGQPVITMVRDGGLWKLLTLPPPPGGTPDDAWLELVECTVDRALDRWCHALQPAVRAA